MRKGHIIDKKKAKHVWKKVKKSFWGVPPSLNGKNPLISFWKVPLHSLAFHYNEETWSMPPWHFRWSCRSEGSSWGYGPKRSSIHHTLPFLQFLLFPSIVNLSPSFSLALILPRVREWKSWRIGEKLRNLRDDLARELDDQEVHTILQDHSTKAFEQTRKSLLLKCMLVLS